MVSADPVKYVHADAPYLTLLLLLLYPETFSKDGVTEGQVRP